MRGLVLLIHLTGWDIMGIVIQTKEVDPMPKNDQTMQFQLTKDKRSPGEILLSVYSAMEEKGYDPINQIVGYLISGDPTYITSYNNARYLIRRLERDELL